MDGWLILSRVNGWVSREVEKRREGGECMAL